MEEVLRNAKNKIILSEDAAKNIIPYIPLDKAIGINVNSKGMKKKTPIKEK